MLKFCNFMFIIQVVFFNQMLLAIDDSYLLDRFILVGVIAQGSKAGSGVAVIKDTASNRSLLLKIGDKLPHIEEWRVKQISRQNIVLAGSGREIEMQVGTVEEEKPKELSSNENSEEFLKVDYQSDIEKLKAQKNESLDSVDLRNLSPEARALIEELRNAPLEGQPRGLKTKRVYRDRLLEDEALEEAPTNLE